MKRPTDRLSPFHHAERREVFTYQPGGWPLGVLTGYADGLGGFVLEHVIVFPYAPWTTLMRMMRDGMEEAWSRGYTCVRFRLPQTFPLAPQLEKVGRRVGFVVDATYADETRYVCRRAA